MPDHEQPPLTLRVNDRHHRVDVPEGTSLLEALRNDIGDKSPKFGCGLEQCGACMVWIDGSPRPSCGLPAEHVTGEVRTAAGLGTASRPHPLQAAFLELQAGQCGYCISGILMSAAALLRDNPRPTRGEVTAALERHLCRCGTHQRFVDAVLAAAGAGA